MTDIRLGSMVTECNGAGSPVVMIHGLGGTSNSFAPLLDKLANYQVLRPDLPGAGRSATRPGQPGIAGLARSVCDMLNATGIKRASFVGHSMGTLICRHIATTQPGRVSRLVLFGAILSPTPTAAAALRARANQTLTEGMGPIADVVAAGSLANTRTDQQSVARAFVRESLLRQNPMGYATHCHALAAGITINDTSIDCPVTLIHGSDDRVASVDQAKTLQQKFGGAHLHVISNCGHWPMIESPTEAATWMLKGLTRE